MASELKIARAFLFESRSPISSSDARGLPRTKAFRAAQALPAGVVGREADSRAVIPPWPLQRKYAAWGRSTTTRRSPSLRPWSGRRPPITARPSPAALRGSQPERQTHGELRRQLALGHRRLDGGDVVLD